MFTTYIAFAALFAAYIIEIQKKQSKADCFLGVVYNLMTCIVASRIGLYGVYYYPYLLAFLIGAFAPFLLLLERIFNYWINPIFGDPQRFDFGFLLRNYETFFRFVSMFGVSGVLALDQTPLEGKIWIFLAITFIRVAALPNLEDPPKPPSKRWKFDWKWRKRRVLAPIPIPNN